MVIGLTGGIATGKSTVFSSLTELKLVNGFDADACVHTLYSDTEVIAELVQQFGEEILDDAGAPCRVKLRGQFLRDRGAKAALESIFHPRVRAKYVAVLESLRIGEHLVADIPLLYENENDYGFDKVVVVGCSRKQQIIRLKERSTLDTLTAMRLVEKQLCLSDKFSKADHTLWNEGNLDQLMKQINTLAIHIFNEC